VSARLPDPRAGTELQRHAFCGALTEAVTAGRSAPDDRRPERIGGQEEALPELLGHPSRESEHPGEALAVTLRQRLPQPLPASRRAVSVLPVRDRMFASSSLPAVSQANFVRRRAEPRYLVAEKRIFAVS
jgi:hypothetical protein